MYRRCRSAALRRHDHRYVIVPLEGAATRGSKRWIDIGRSSSSRRSSARCPRVFAGGVPRRPRQANRGAATRRRGRGLAARRVPRVRPAGHRHGARLRGRHRERRSSSPAFAGRTWRSSAAWCDRRPVVLGPPAPAHRLEGVRTDRLTASCTPTQSARDDLNISSRSRRSARASCAAAVSRGDQTSLNYLSEHRTDFVFASFGEQRGFLGSRSCCCSDCSSSGAG